MSGRAPKPFWSLPGGGTVDGLPSPIDVKNVGGRVMFGSFYVEFDRNERDAPYNWHTGERRGIGTSNPADDWFGLDSFRTFREAVAEARLLAAITSARLGPKGGGK